MFRYWETRNFQRKIVIPPLLHKISKSMVELMYVTLWKPKFKTVVSFLTVCKSWSQYICSWVKNIPVLAGRLVHITFGFTTLVYLTLWIWQNCNSHWLFCLPKSHVVRKQSFCQNCCSLAEPFLNRFLRTTSQHGRASFEKEFFCWRFIWVKMSTLQRLVKKIRQTHNEPVQFQQSSHFCNLLFTWSSG